MYKFNLPWPPSINDYYGRSKNGGVFIKKKGVSFRNITKLLICTYPTLSGNLKVEIEACFPDNRKRDLDNLLKCTLDAMQRKKGETKGIYLNDTQIIDLRIFKGEMTKKGKLIISIQEV